MRWPPSWTRGCGRPARATPTTATGLIVDGAGHRPLGVAAGHRGRAVRPAGLVADRRRRRRRAHRRAAARSSHRPGSPARPVPRPGRPHFADAGMTILRRARRPTGGEIWCRCDGGPHGFLSIAAHAHADALSVEVRHDGVDVLADPGTYCYHGEPAWRALLPLDARRTTPWSSTAPTSPCRVARSCGPGTPEPGAGRSASSRRAPRAGRPSTTATAAADSRLCTAGRSSSTATRRTLRVVDEVDSPLRPRPAGWRSTSARSSTADCDGARALLSWTPTAATQRSAVLELPDRLRWTAHRGELDPPLGWYSAGFGRREPATTLVGHGRIEPGGTHD